MKNTNKAFTLVELLVVITILSIISVVAYQSFGGAIGKAVSARKMNDVATIETSLKNYKIQNNFYPAVDVVDTNNMWGYDSGTGATQSNTLTVNKTGQAIDSINVANGGGRVMGIDANSINWSTKQIGAKGTISQETMGKEYLTRDLYDPELGDIKVGASGKMIDYGIGRYVYAVYRKPLDADTTWGSDNKQGTYFNIAYTVLKDGTDTYVTKIVGDYDRGSCFENSDNCPNTLIGSGNNFLTDGQENSSSNTAASNQGIPYPASNY